MRLTHPLKIVDASIELIRGVRKILKKCQKKKWEKKSKIERVKSVDPDEMAHLANSVDLHCLPNEPSLLYLQCLPRTFTPR